MIAKVKKAFIDKQKNVLCKANAVIEVTDARAKEIQKAGDFIAPVKALDELTVDELKSYATFVGVDLGEAEEKDAIIEALTKK